MAGCCRFGVGAAILVAGQVLAGCGDQHTESGNPGSAGAGPEQTGGTGATGQAGSGPDIIQPECPDDALACNGVCVAPGQSANGCTVLGTSGGSASIDHGMTLDATHLYWVEQGTRVAVARLPKTGGAREDLLLTEDIPYSPAVNSSLVFFSEEGFSDSRLESIAKTGGDATVLTTHSDSLKDIVATETRVYFAREYFLDSRREIVSVPTAGGEEIIHGTSGAFGDNYTAVDATHVYWVNDGFFDPSTIERAPLEGTTSEVVVTAEGIRDYAIVGPTIYFYSNQTDSIQRVPASGGTAEVVYTMSDAPSSWLVLAATEQYVYWNGASSVWRVGTDGSAPTVLMTTSGWVTAVVADASGVYGAVNLGAHAGPSFLVKIDEP